jgi:DNA-binding SARP family transcriptional activator
MLKDTLESQLLGSPQLRWHDQPLEFVPPKLCAVLYYLAVQGRPVSRSELEHLFWGPGSGESLRQALHHLRGLPGATHWLQTGPEVCIDTRSDLKVFEAAINGEQHGRALEIWPNVQPSSAGSSVLLWGFKLESTPAFGDWLEFERARVAMLYLESLERHAFELERAGAVDEALLTVQTLLREDPLNESAYRAAMRLSQQNGQPEMARYYLERCRRVLRQELGVQPLEETVELSRIPGVVASARVEARTLRQALELLSDPRGQRGQRYSLPAVLGLVLLALLCGEDSLRGISRFVLEHPNVLRALGFRGNTVPGRSALSDVLDQLDSFRLREAFKSVSGLPTLGLQGDTLECLRRWSLEVQQSLDPKRLNGLLEQLGWPGLQGSVIFAENGDRALALRTTQHSNHKATAPGPSMRIGTSRKVAPEIPRLIKVDLQSQPDRLGSGANLEL